LQSQGQSREKRQWGKKNAVSALLNERKHKDNKDETNNVNKQLGSSERISDNS
jgi:hypothetical protein